MTETLPDEFYSQNHFDCAHLHELLSLGQPIPDFTYARYQLLNQNSPSECSKCPVMQYLISSTIIINTLFHRFFWSRPSRLPLEDPQNRTTSLLNDWQIPIMYSDQDIQNLSLKIPLFTTFTDEQIRRLVISQAVSIIGEIPMSGDTGFKNGLLIQVEIKIRQRMSQTSSTDQNYKSAKEYIMSEFIKYFTTRPPVYETNGSQN